MFKTRCAVSAALAVAVLCGVSCTNLDFPPNQAGKGDSGSPVRTSIRLRISNSVQIPQAIIEPTDNGDGIANTTASGDDIQAIRVGSAADPGSPIVLPGPNGQLDTEPSGDDVLGKVDVDLRVEFLLDGQPFVARVPAGQNLTYDLGALPDGLVQRFPNVPSCPSQITLVAETWYPDDTYLFIDEGTGGSREVDEDLADQNEVLVPPIGGRSYLGTTQYNWLSGELSCSDTIWYDFRIDMLYTFKVGGG